MRGVVGPLRAGFLLLALMLAACGGGGGGAAAGDPRDGSGGGGVGETPLPAAHLGANLPAAVDWSRTPVFVDLLRQARAFGSPDAPWDGRALLGADGWPVGDFGAVLMTSQAGVSGVAGTYIVSFDGQATVSAPATAGTLAHASFDAATGRSRVELTLAAGADQLMLAFRGTGAGIRNLRVLRPGYSEATPPRFTREFLAHVARFRTLRFMDWLATNGNPVAHWAERSTPATTHHASPAGLPWEDVIALANEARKDIWINIPVAADDDYVLQLARLLKASLNPERKVYVEYSNEVWNNHFPQSAVNRTLALAEVAADSASPLIYDRSGDTWTWAFRRVAKRLKEISDLFRSVYGDAAMMHTVLPVLAGQAANPYVAGTGLDMVAAVWGAPSRYFHAVAGAPYFNLGDQQVSEGLSTDQVIDALSRSAARIGTDYRLETQVAQARWHGLAWLAYEGGPDTFGPGSLAAKQAAALDPRLQGLCSGMLHDWYAQGGGMFMWFTAGAGRFDTAYGTWELTTDLARTDTPKIRCMDEVLAGTPPAASGRNAVPGSWSALASPDRFPPYADSALRYLHVGASRDWLVSTARAGTYALVLNASAVGAGNRVDVAVNGQVQRADFALAATASDAGVANTPISITLPEGLSTLRITTRAEAGGFALYTLTAN